jgi:hypothetical protein
MPIGFIETEISPVHREVIEHRADRPKRGRDERNDPEAAGGISQ